MSVPTAIQQLVTREAPAESAADHDEFEDCPEPSAKRARGLAESPILVFSRWLTRDGTNNAAIGGFQIGR